MNWTVPRWEVEASPPVAWKRTAPFGTADLAAAAGISRPLARKVAYCLRRCGLAQVVGKEGNAILYQLPACG